MERKRQQLTWEEGWPVIENGFRKVVRIIEGSEEKITSEEYMINYITVYELSLAKDRHDEDLYSGYKSLIEQYVSEKVLPSLAQKNGFFLLEEVSKRWSGHLTMIRWISRFFHFLDRYYTQRNRLPSLHDAGLECFRLLVHDATYARIKDAFLTLIYGEREGEKIDNAMLRKNAELLVSIKPNGRDYDEEMSKLLSDLTIN